MVRDPATIVLDSLHRRIITIITIIIRDSFKSSPTFCTPEMEHEAGQEKHVPSSETRQDRNASSSSGSDKTASSWAHRPRLEPTRILLVVRHGVAWWQMTQACKLQTYREPWAARSRYLVFKLVGNFGFGCPEHKRLNWLSSTMVQVHACMQLPLLPAPAIYIISRGRIKVRARHCESVENQRKRCEADNDISLDRPTY